MATQKTHKMTDTVREWIKEDSRSVTAIAEAADLGRSTLQRFYRRERNLTADQFCQLLRAFGSKITTPKKLRK